MKRILLVCFLLMAGLATPAAAQMSSAAAGEVENIERVVPFAKKVERELGQRGAVVAIVARMGRDPDQMPDEVGKYTHVGIWVYSEVTAADGRKVNGYAIYNLYQNADDNGRSSLVQDFPVEFFGRVFDLNAGIIVPTPEVQQELLRVVTSPGYEKLHVPAYSVVANPYEWRYQNCTNFIMAVLVSAVYGTSDRKDISGYLRAYYEPSDVGIGGVTRVLGSLFVDGFATSDHRGGELRTSTYDSIASFMTQYGLADAVLEVTEEETIVRMSREN